MLDFQKLLEIIIYRLLGWCRNLQTVVLLIAKSTYTRSKFCLKYLHRPSCAYSPIFVYDFFISLIISYASGKLEIIILIGKTDVLQTGCSLRFVCLCPELLRDIFGTHILLSRSFNYWVVGWTINLLWVSYMWHFQLMRLLYKVLAPLFSYTGLVKKIVLLDLKSVTKGQNLKTLLPQRKQLFVLAMV